jgi:hypothetical protein
MLCPYCEVEITIRAIDAEDGFCPECGAAIDPSLIFSDADEDVSEDPLDDDDVLLGGGFNVPK